MTAPEIQRCARVLAALVSGTLLGCGSDAAETTRTERHVALEGQPNFRDLGGYATTDGRTVLWGQLYRSGELPHLTDDDVARLEQLGLETLINFLLPEEIEQNGPDRLPPGIREVSLPIRGERTAELALEAQEAIRSGRFEDLPPELNPEFHRLLLEDGKAEYAALLRAAMDPANRPLVFHCSHGVHRTGTAAAILLSALGVPWETVRDDYLLTNTYRAQEVRAQLERIRTMVAAGRGIPPEEVDMTNVEAFYVLEGAYIDGSLQHAIQRYGSMQGYIRDGLGITDDELATLRSELLAR